MAPDLRVMAVLSMLTDRRAVVEAVGAGVAGWGGITEWVKGMRALREAMGVARGGHLRDGGGGGGGRGG